MTVTTASAAGGRSRAVREIRAVGPISPGFAPSPSARPGGASGSFAAGRRPR
jgi:hypothetical protein